jgi:HEAT repeat protein
MPTASLPVRRRLPKRTADARWIHRCGTSWLWLVAVIGMVSIGCTTDAEQASVSPRGRSGPQLEKELPERLASITKGLCSEVPADRAYAAAGLGRLGAEAGPAVPLLVDCLGDGDWLVRRQAAEALGPIGDPVAVEPLIEVVADRDGEWGVRTAAARSLGLLGDARAVEPLIGVLNDMSAHVRHMAVIALGRIGTPEAVEALAVAARSDSDGATRFSAAEAIRTAEEASVSGEVR